MRFFLPLILALISPIPTMASKIQAVDIPANPATSQELNSLNKQHTELQNERISLTRKQDFWHAVTINLGVIVAVIGVLAWAAAYIESQKSHAQRRVDNQLAVVDSQISDWKKRDADWRIEGADLKRVALENRIVDIFGPRQVTLEQSVRIAGKLAGLSGVKIDVYVLAVGDPYTADDAKDSENIGRAVVRTLRGAPAFMDAEGWLLEDCQGAWASNVVVSVRLPGSDAEREIATRLIKSLRSEIGTYPEISDHPPFCTKFSDLEKSRPNKRKHDATISITIGRKINPLLTRDMLEPDDEPKNP